jgi:hypothetical protein
MRRRQTSIKTLEATADTINKLAGTPTDPRAVGSYVISDCCGGVALEQVSDEHGTTRTVFHRTTKRELHQTMLGIVYGLGLAFDKNNNQ